MLPFSPWNVAIKIKFHSVTANADFPPCDVLLQALTGSRGHRMGHTWTGYVDSPLKAKKTPKTSKLIIFFKCIDLA